MSESELTGEELSREGGSSSLNTWLRVRDRDPWSRWSTLVVALVVAGRRIGRCIGRRRSSHGRRGIMRSPPVPSRELHIPDMRDYKACSREGVTCKQLARWGFPPRIDLLRRMAEILLQQHSTPQTLGKQWHRKFLQRHNDQLRYVYSRRLEHKRACAHNTTSIIEYFDLYHREKLLKDIRDEDTWNFDEKGLLIGYASTSKVRLLAFTDIYL
jgi:hypothetical protein